jgi:hypothetical protein
MATDEQLEEWRQTLRLARARAVRKDVTIDWERLGVVGDERQATLSLAESLPPPPPEEAAANGSRGRRSSRRD